MEIQIANQTRRLAKENIEQTALILGMPGVPRALRLAPNCIIYSTRAPLPILIKSESGRGTIGLEQSWFVGAFSWLILNLSRRKTSRFNIIHAHGNGYAWPLLIATIARKLYRLPLVLTIHCSCIATYSPISGLDDALRFVARIAERWALSNAEKVFVLTPRLAKFYAEKNMVPANKIHVIPDCIDVDKFRSLATPERIESFISTYGIPRHKKIVIFLGRIAPEKGWWFFVQAASRIRRTDVHFLVCGGGVQEEKLKEMIDKLGLSGRFTVTGFVPHEMVPSALSIAHLFVCTSVHEELGSSILEAMALRCPIVAHKTGGIPYVVEDGVSALLVPLGRVDKLVQAIENLIDDRELARKLADEAYHVANERYDMNSMIEQMMRLYSIVVSEANAK
jgi:2-deoxystreptamine N-acetyl-D-glucosaminyltransferase/2-deoxystreptamine glucosyltransferase